MTEVVIDKDGNKVQMYSARFCRNREFLPYPYGYPQVYESHDIGHDFKRCDYDSFSK